MTTNDRPIGLRLHNPGLLPLGKARYRGAVRPQSGDKHVRFKVPQEGIGGMAVVYRNLDRDGVNTVEGILAAWPTPMPDLAAAIADTAKRLEVDPLDWLDVDDYATAKPLTEGIIFALNGRQPYKAQVIADGLRIGRIHNAPRKALVRRGAFALPTTISGLSITTLAAQAVDPLKKFIDTGLTPFADAPPVQQATVIGLTLCAVLGAIGAGGAAVKHIKGLDT